MTNQCERRERHDEENGKEDYASVFEPPVGGSFDAVQNPVSPEIQKNCRQREIEDLHLCSFQALINTHVFRVGRSRCWCMARQAPGLVASVGRAHNRRNDRFQALV